MKKNLSKYAPTPARLRASWKLRIIEFLRENSLHGFSYFVDPRRPLWERIVWFTFTMTSIIIVFPIMVSVLRTFGKDPFYTSLTSNTAHVDVYFPNIVLCPLNPTFDFGAHKSHAAHFQEMYDWWWEPIKTEPPPMTNESYSDIFLRSTPDCEELYPSRPNKKGMIGEKSVKIIWTRGVCCHIVAQPLHRTNTQHSQQFEPKHFPSSVDILEKYAGTVLRESPYSYELVTYTEVKLLPDLTFSSEKLTSLPRSVRDCHVPEESISYNDCLFREQKTMMFQECGCVPWYMSMSSGGRRQCKVHEYTCLAEKAAKILGSNTTCIMGCNHTTYKIDKIRYIDGKVTQFVILDRPSVVYFRELRADWLDLLVTFGGMGGLFVGYSLLTTVELAYYFSLRPYCGAVLAESQKPTRIIVGSAKIRKRRKIHVIDLKNNYYDYVD